MSKARARKRAQQRAARSHPKPHSPGTLQPAVSAAARKPTRSRLEQRRRQRWLLVAVAWLAVNAASLLLLDTWSARWVVLVLSTIAVPVVVWLAWDPEGRVDL